MRIGVPLSLALIVLLFATGCSPGTPPEVVAASKVEGEMIASYKAFVDKALATAYADLETAINEQLDIIVDYEIVVRASGDTVAVAKMQDLIAAYRAKREEVKLQLALVRQQIAQADVTMSQIQKLHDKMTAYLARRSISYEDVVGMVDEIRSAWKGVPSE